jgi:RNA polymerase sigma-70 factor (ECF subfamily)
MEAGVPQLGPEDYEDKPGDHAPPADDPSSVSVTERKRLFANLILPYLDDAFSLARWLTGNHVDAEDVVQDASLRAFRAIEQLNRGDPRIWLLKIVRNTSYLWLRKNRPATILTVEDLEGVEQLQTRAFEPDADTPENALIAKTEIKRLKAMIEKLPRPIREILIMRDVQGRSYREIAEICGMPLGTVMSRLARARNSLERNVTAPTSEPSLPMDGVRQPRSRHHKQRTARVVGASPSPR